MTVRYFAYGSNMLTERLRARCPSARPLGAAWIGGFSLGVGKKGKDGSGKATIMTSLERQTVVHGVVFELAADEMPVLDRIEGRGAGYDRIETTAVRAGGTSARLPVTTYIAQAAFLIADLRPFDWYLGLVVAGAEQHGLPGDHLASLKAVSAIADPDPTRRTRREAETLLATWHAE